MKVISHFAFMYVLLFCSLSASAAEIRVGKQEAVKSIRQALTMAKAGDHILINSGRYAEGRLVIDKPIFIEGVGDPVMDGEGEAQIFTIISDDVHIKGITFTNTGYSYVEDRAAIRVQQSRNVIIEDNILDDTFFAIYLAKSRNCFVRNNEIHGQAKRETNSGNAIHLWYCDSIFIDHNMILGHRDGIYLEFVNYSLISGNTSTLNMRYGLHFMFSNHNEYLKNTFKDNGAGVAVMYSKGISMIGNTFRDNWGDIAHGLLLKDITDSRIEKNLFLNNTIGIYAEGSNRIQIRNNTFERNGWALKIMGNCDANIISRNNFLANTFEVTTNSNHSFNTFTENYWSGYSGYDLDRDGIGDVPYRPVKLYSYLVEKIPASVVLLRSLFVDVLNLAEKVTPVLTPEALVDEQPLMKKI